MSEPENGNPWDDLVADLGLPTDTPKPVVDEPAVEAAVEEPAPDKPVEEPGDRSRGRHGHGRDRRPERDDGPRAGAQEVEETPVEIAGDQREPASAGEDVDDLSNWNVPTWAELIGSLHRPER